jgi:hypothetical protein
VHPTNTKADLTSIQDSILQAHATHPLTQLHLLLLHCCSMLPAVHCPVHPCGFSGIKVGVHRPGQQQACTDMSHTSRILSLDSPIHNESHHPAWQNCQTTVQHLTDMHTSLRGTLTALGNKPPITCRSSTPHIRTHTHTQSAHSLRSDSSQRHDCTATPLQ